VTRRRHTKFVREGQYGAEVDIELIDGQFFLRRQEVEQELSLSGGRLEQGPQRGRQGGASPGRAVRASRLHRHELGPAESGGRTVLQPAGHGGAMDQGRQTGDALDTAVVSSVARS
jgi:hypothetical protein